MKILIVNAFFYPEVNGVVVTIDNLAKQFLKQGHQVTIVASGKPGKQNSNSLTILRYKTSKSKELLKFYKEHSSSASETIKSLNQKFDIVITRSHIFLNELKKIFPKQKILYIAPSLMAFYLKGYGKTNSLLKEQIKEAIVGTEVIVWSKNLQEQYKKNLNIYSKVISPGINFEKKLCAEPPIKRQDIILFVGRISEEKNLPALLRAFQKTKKGKLWIVGDGEEKEKLEQLIKKLHLEKRISFLGKTARPEKFYSNAKIFVLPSKYESFGLVLLEAMASGLPCIAFKPDGKNILTASNEIIKNNKTGFLVKDEKEMAEKIDLLLSDDKLRTKMGNAGREESKKYSWEKTAKEILKSANHQP